MRSLLFLWMLSLSALGAGAEVKGYGPWHFGMSKEEVGKVEEAAPYKEVPATGGLETATATWDGNKTNVSFIFEKDQLAKVQIWAYEGKDIEKALVEWAHVARYLKAAFGPVEFPAVPELKPESTEQEQIATYRQKLTAEGEEAVSRFQMGLKKMPEGAIVFASLFRNQESGYYYVFLYYRKA